MQERGTVPALIAAVAAAVVAADQLAKSWAERALDDRMIELVWTLRLRLTYNRGAAFGLADGLTPFITAGVVAVLIMLVVLARSVTGRLPAVAMGLLVGGALGNLVDRLVRDNDGAVIDFIDLQWWPVFNLADAAVVIGAGLLLLTSGKRQ